MNLKCNFCIDKNKIIEGIIHFFFSVLLYKKVLYSQRQSLSNIPSHAS